MIKLTSDCVHAAFQHIGFANSELSSSATSYSATSFPFFEDLDDSSIAESDAVDYDEI